MIFNEDSRAKIPCILHLVRLGYTYLPLKDATWDEENNIFPDLFRTAIARRNDGSQINQCLSSTFFATIKDYNPLSRKVAHKNNRDSTC